MAAEPTRRRFGQLTKMRSGRWQARYRVPQDHPSGRGGLIVTAPHTFEPTRYGKDAASDWLRDEERRLNSEGADWLTEEEKRDAARAAEEAARKPTFESYAQVWLRTRRVKGKALQPSTARGYKIWLEKYLIPAFGRAPSTRSPQPW